MFTLEALQRSYLKGKRANHREHVNEYIQENPELFRIEELHVNPTKNKPEVRLTVDTEEDYHRACFIVERCRNEYITAEKAINLYSEFKLSKEE